MALPGMGQRRDPEAATRVRGWVVAALGDGDDRGVVVTELACTEPGCAPVETLIGLLSPGCQVQHKIHKSLSEVTRTDVETALKLRDPLS